MSQDGGELLYDCTVKLPKLDQNASIVTELVQRLEIVKQDECIDINCDVVTRKIVMEKVSIEATPGHETLYIHFQRIFHFSFFGVLVFFPSPEEQV